MARMHYQVSKDYAELSHWSYTLTLMAKQAGATEHINDVIKSLNNKMTDAINGLLGDYTKKEQKTATSLENNVNYLKAMGDRPFKSLNEILTRVSSLTQKSDSE